MRHDTNVNSEGNKLLGTKIPSANWTSGYKKSFTSISWPIARNVPKLLFLPKVILMWQMKNARMKISTPKVFFNSAYSYK